MEIKIGHIKENNIFLDIKNNILTINISEDIELKEIIRILPMAWINKITAYKTGIINISSDLNTLIEICRRFEKHGIMEREKGLSYSTLISDILFEKA